MSSKFALGVSAFEQHEAKRKLGQNPVHGTEVQVIYGLVDRFLGRVFSQIDDKGLSSGLKNSMHLFKRTLGFAEILESRSTQKEIE